MHAVLLCATQIASNNTLTVFAAKVGITHYSLSILTLTEAEPDTSQMLFQTIISLIDKLFKTSLTIRISIIL